MSEVEVSANDVADLFTTIRDPGPYHVETLGLPTRFITVSYRFP
jgi:hypothetical protein